MKPITPTRWHSLPSAAQFLGLSVEALRKQLERKSVMTHDGGVEAHIDGVVGRKFGRLWRVAFSNGWVAPCGR